MHHDGIDETPSGAVPDGGPVAPALTANKPLGPVKEADRIQSLDVLRGVAILGIFFVNIQFFALPIMEAVGFGTLGDAPRSEQLGWAFIKTFCEFKFISMFSLLFGAGMVVQMLRAETAGRSFVPVYLRRLGILLLFGLAHALLLWYGDILFVYAILGAVLLLLRKVSARTLLIIASILLVVGLVFVTSVSALQMMLQPMQSAAQVDRAAAPSETVLGDTVVAPNGDATDAIAGAVEEDEPVLRGLEAIKASQGDPNRDVWTVGETLAYREGPFLDAFAFRAITWVIVLISAIFGYGWRVVGMFLLGAALMKLDFFRPRQIRWQRWMMLAGLGLGLPLEVLATALIWYGGFEMNETWLLATAVHDVASTALCLGYVGLICTLVSTGALRWLTHPFTYVGRLALSTYLLSTIVATGIMYWWGLGFFGSLGRPALIGIVAVAYAGLMLFSIAWLQVFRIGPFEWLWRTLTYLRPQPLLRDR